LKSLIPILESKTGSSIDIVLDFRSFDMNNEIQLPYLHSSVDIFFDEDSSIYGHCLLLDPFLENLTNYISTYKKGKSKRPFENRTCILVKRKKI
jgi:hypothetical protein